MLNPQPVNKLSADVVADRVAALKELYPEAFIEGKVDFVLLRQALGEVVDDGPERYNFTWAGKRDAIRLHQAPTNATLVPCQEESISWDTAENLFIEGDNLEVLKLLYKPYFGKIKLIYIDPPYNTGNDFIYADNYADSIGSYMRFTGQRDTEGNDASSEREIRGRYHSRWLTMMYPRLLFARQLLRDDGVIFISIDDHEVHNLRRLCNEVFGEENFVANIVWQKKYAVSNDDPGIAPMHDHIIVYQRSARFARNLLPRTEKQIQRYNNPDNDPRGDWSSDNYISNKSRQERPTLWYPIRHPRTGEDVWPEESAVWRYSREKHQKIELEGRLFWGPDLSYKRPRLKRFLSEIQKGIVPSTWWTFQEVGHNDEGQKETAQLLGPKVFSTPKPVRLMHRIIELSTGPTDIVLDFFAGSGAMGHAVLDTNRRDGGNRKFILVQLPEPTGRSDFPTIADMTKQRIRRVIEQMKSKKKDNPEFDTGYFQDLGFRTFKLAASTFQDWQGVAAPTPDEYITQLDAFADPLFAGFDPDSVIWELVIKEGFPLSSRIEAMSLESSVVHRVTNPDSGGFIHICLDTHVEAAVITELELERNDLFMCRDLAIDDTTAANLALQCRLRTI